MVSPQRCRRRQRGQKKLSWGWRIACSGAATGSRPVGRPRSGANSRSDSSTASRPCAGRARAASTRACRTGDRRRSCCRRYRGRSWYHRDRRLDDDGFGNLDWGRRGGDYCRRIRRRRLDLHEPEPFLRSATGAARSASPAARGSRPATPNRRLGFEISACNGEQHEKNDQRMGKKRGGDTLPPPLFPGWYADRGSVPVTYGAAASFGDTPITFTPAPRATSIAKMTCEYLTPLGAPLTKMIFSGRGS